jgi:hypothetical protein
MDLSALLSEHYLLNLALTKIPAEAPVLWLGDESRVARMGYESSYYCRLCADQTE